MKSPVIGPGSRVQDARRGRSADRNAGGGFAVHLRADAPAEPAAVTTPQELVGLSAILALQEAVGDAAEDRRRALHRHGASILDRLDQLRADLLLGRVSPAQLIALAQQLRARPPSTGHEGLDAILGEIELRAEVEIAKRLPGRGSATDAPSAAGG